MSVVLNEVGMAQYFNSTTGPWGRYLALRADTVRDTALANAQGPLISVDTTDLISNTNIRLDGKATGAEAQIGSTAQHRGVNYPGFVTRAGGTPGGWLIEALESHFPNVRRNRPS